MDRRTNKRPTMKDVAQKAGVTIGTVSHVLNGTATISDKTTLRVRKAMEELDYVPNSLARNMRTKDNKMIGLMVPKLTNSFYAQLASVFMDQANQDDYTVLLLGYEYSLEQEKKELNSLVQNNVGTIIIANGYNDEIYIRDLLSKNVRVILADRRTAMKDVSYVEFNNIDVMAEAVGLLRKKGYQSVGFITEPLTLTNLSDRFTGFQKGMEENGYTYREEHVFVSDAFRLNHVKNAYLYMKRLLEERRREELPEAFIASSDLLAIGIMRAIHENGYTIPKDFGIIGCDNLQISGYLQPALTTINQDGVMLARELWRMTKDRNSGRMMENVVLKQELIIRESC